MWLYRYGKDFGKNRLNFFSALSHLILIFYYFWKIVQDWINPKSHNHPNSHTFFGLTKMWILWVRTVITGRMPKILRKAFQFFFTFKERSDQQISEFQSLWLLVYTYLICVYFKLCVFIVFGDKGSFSFGWVVSKIFEKKS